MPARCWQMHPLENPPDALSLVEVVNPALRDKGGGGGLALRSQNAQTIQIRISRVLHLNVETSQEGLMNNRRNLGTFCKPQTASSHVLPCLPSQANSTTPPGAQHQPNGPQGTDASNARLQILTDAATVLYSTQLHSAPGALLFIMSTLLGLPPPLLSPLAYCPIFVRSYPFLWTCLCTQTKTHTATGIIIGTK